MNELLLVTMAAVKLGFCMIGDVHNSVEVKPGLQDGRCIEHCTRQWVVARWGDVQEFGGETGAARREMY
jgi:hypothetical protein